MLGAGARSGSPCPLCVSVTLRATTPPLAAAPLSKHLLHLRDPAAPLEICDISSDCAEDARNSDWAEEAFDLMEPFLQYAISCKVQVLGVSFPLWANNMASSHLLAIEEVILELENMAFVGSSLDFSTCQVLEVIFRRDLKRCPMFSKLKTLCLDQWCVSGDFIGLVYFLRHSPALETLRIRVDVDYLIKEVWRNGLVGCKLFLFCMLDARMEPMMDQLGVKRTPFCTSKSLNSSLYLLVQEGVN